jgi:hypothetical protein
MDLAIYPRVAAREFVWLEPDDAHFGVRRSVGGKIGEVKW